MREEEEEDTPRCRQVLVCPSDAQHRVGLESHRGSLLCHIRVHRQWPIVGDLPGVTRLGRRNQFLKRVALQRLLGLVWWGPREVVDAEDHVLRRTDDGVTSGRRAKVGSGRHERLQLLLRLLAERQVHSHRIAVEVSVEGRTNEGVDLNRLAVRQLRAESLDAEAVEGRCPVEQDEPVLHSFLQKYHLALFGQIVLEERHGGLAALNSVIFLSHFMNYEGLKEISRQSCRQSTLVQPQTGIHHDHRPCRVVHALAEHVETHAPHLALQPLCHSSHGSTLASKNIGGLAIVDGVVHPTLQCQLASSQSSA
mmetsp:Transcript_39174/g.98510  ORF Transcript_39174/g.98510 Transcript_39174/m.98510 type:complete len:309 (-) Transcript_39174:2335-3261(-)